MPYQQLLKLLSAIDKGIKNDFMTVSPRVSRAHKNLH